MCSRDSCWAEHRRRGDDDEIDDHDEGGRLGDQTVVNQWPKHYCPTMSTLTVPIPDEDLEFLRALAERAGTSPEAFIAKQTRLMRERYESPLHPDVIRATGVINGDVDVRKEYLDHMERKHA